MAESRWFSYGCCQPIPALAVRMAAPVAELSQRCCGWTESTSQPAWTWTVQPQWVPTSPRAWEGLQPPKHGACGAAECRVSSKVLLGKALGLLVCLLFYTLLQTFNLVTKRNHGLLHHHQLPTSPDLPLMPRFSFAGSMVKAWGPARRQPRCCSTDRGRNTQEQPPEDGRFSCERGGRDSKDQQLALSSPGSDGAPGAVASSFTQRPPPKRDSPLAAPRVLAGLHVPSPARGVSSRC